ncbi:cell wall hydrolase [Neobacillus rhizosphaerae]|uniref:cell wall hydrolase n=1 Tax=Neobacillus rhizosphaerae TaxID=2880965 RepID=UPI003D2C76AD
MKRTVSFLLSVIIFFILLNDLNLPLNVNAKNLDKTKVHKVTKRETLREISHQYGNSKDELIKMKITEKEMDLLARLVTAEAKGEPYQGKVAVAAVVLNRLESEQFPDSIQQVIYQDKQFQPVDNGMINKPAGEEAKKAVDEAINKDGQVTDALYFFNPDETNSKWLRTRPVTEEIGNHRFAS